MSFLRITDPVKRDFLVQELINTRRKVYDESLSEKFGDITKQHELSKLFKPITSEIKQQAETISTAQQATQKAITDLPQQLAIMQP